MPKHTSLSDIWRLYYAENEFREDEGRLAAAREYVKFFDGTGSALVEHVDWAFDGTSFDYQVLVTNTPLVFAGQLAKALRDTPLRVINMLGMALCMLRARVHPSNTPVKITPRIYNVEPVVSLTSLKATSVGKLVCIRGNVVHVGAVAPMVLRVDFKCAKCGSVMTQAFDEGKFEPPQSCASSTCRARKFLVERQTAVTVDFQRIKLQEMQDTNEHEAGSMPKSIECELSRDLVDACIPGDVVTVVGEVKLLNAEVESGRSGKSALQNSLFLLYIEANSVSNRMVSSSSTFETHVASTSTDSSSTPAASSSTPSGASSTSASVVSQAPQNRSQLQSMLHSKSARDIEEGSIAEITLGEQKSAAQISLRPREVNSIREIAKKYGERMFSVLVHSFCPAIFGQEIAKAGLLLGIFGGSKGSAADYEGTAEEEAGRASVQGGAEVGAGAGAGGNAKEEHVSTRPDSHVLLVGDPGLGKSQLLRAAAQVAPRSVYICGNTTTTTGLTVTVVKEKGGKGSGGDAGLEAGALVLADQGVCCIDEFDKMGVDYQALLEAMEQQRISIAKSGIVCSLCARTTVLAAANPVGGHYNRAKSVAQNLKMSAPLLSRFDLIFILLDKADAERDSMLAHHVMNRHGGRDMKRQRHTDTTSRSAGGGSDWGGGEGSAGSAGMGWGANNGSATAGEDFGWSGGGGGGGGARASVGDRLRASASSERRDLMPRDMMRKYIAFAKQSIHPMLSAGAAQLLQKQYLKLRQEVRTQDSIPITTRQLESMIRLVQARARMELRTVATVADAQDVLDILQDSVREAVSDEFGVEFGGDCGDMFGGGKKRKMSLAKQVKLFVRALHTAAEIKGDSMFQLKAMKELASKAGLDFGSVGQEFQSFIDTVNEQSYIIKKGPQMYKLLSGSV
jgi:DNA helicase MCM8